MYYALIVISTVVYARMDIFYRRINADKIVQFIILQIKIQIIVLHAIIHAKLAMVFKKINVKPAEYHIFTIFQLINASNNVGQHFMKIFLA